jgi:hypothetical protein
MAESDNPSQSPESSPTQDRESMNQLIDKTLEKSRGVVALGKLLFGKVPDQYFAELATVTEIGDPKLVKTAFVIAAWSDTFQLDQSEVLKKGFAKAALGPKLTGDPEKDEKIIRLTGLTFNIRQRMSDDQ